MPRHNDAATRHVDKRFETERVGLVRKEHNRLMLYAKFNEMVWFMNRAEQQRRKDGRRMDSPHKCLYSIAHSKERLE